MVEAVVIEIGWRLLAALVALLVVGMLVYIDRATERRERRALGPPPKHPTLTRD